jgi:hypothetical protein
MKTLLLILSAGLFITTQTQAGPVVFTFDELPTQAVDGLTFGGVTYHFTEDGIASTDAQYDTPGPSPALFLSPPVLSGPLIPSVAIQLLMSFEVPILTLDFGIALDTVDTETPGASLTLFDGQGNLLNTYNINTSVQIVNGFSEAQFSYGDPSIPGSLAGPAIGSAALTFPTNLAPDLFAIDNLTILETPEPMSWVIVLTGILMIALSRFFSGILRISRRGSRA